VRGVHEQQLAAQRGAGATLGPGDEAVSAERAGQHRQLQVGHGDRAGTREQLVHAAAHQLEARDGEEPHDRERPQRLELAVPVGVVLVRLLGRQADDGQGQDVVQGVDGGVERAAQNGHRAGNDPDEQPGPEDRQVGDQNGDQHTADAGGPIRRRGL